MRQEVFPIVPSGILPADQSILQSILSGVSISAPLAITSPQTAPKYVSQDFFNLSPLASQGVNDFFTALNNDLARLFAASNYNDLLIHALERLGYDQLSSIGNTLNALHDQILSTADLQIGYDAGFTTYKRVNFITDASIERNPALIGGTPITHDVSAQQVTLGLASFRDVLHSEQGDVLVNAAIDNQLGYPLQAYSQLRTPMHALDANARSYWGEVVLADSPVRVEWPTPDSVYLPAATAGAIPFLTEGALAEYTISFTSPESFNTISIEPFCGLPINIAGIFVVKRDPIEVAAGEHRMQAVGQDFSRYSVSEYNSARKNGYLFLNDKQQLQLPMQEDVTALTIVFHQPHYTKEIFSLPLRNVNLHNLWQQMLGNVSDIGQGTLDLTYINDATHIISDIATVVGANLVNNLTSADNPIQSYVRYQYVYGAYSIEVSERRYLNTGTLVSTKFNSGINLSQGAVISDVDLPFVETTVETGSWFGPFSLMPLTYSVPAAVVTYDLAYGDSQTWNPTTTLNAKTVYEPLIIDNPVSHFNLRLQAKPGTPIYISSFDGIGGAFLLGAVFAPPVADLVPTNVILPSIQLNAPGFYVIEYTPIDTSTVVDFAFLLGPEPSSFQKSWVAVPVSPTQALIADQLRGLKLPEVPYVAPERIGQGFEPNGLSGSEYVPMTVTIENFPMSFIDPVTSQTNAVNTYHQDTGHLKDLYETIPVVAEVLNSSDSNPAAAIHFSTQFRNWDVSSAHFPQIYQLSQNGPQVVIPQISAAGTANWEINPDAGTITFVNGNAAVSGQIAISYWYYGTAYAQPFIINRTNYLTQIEPALTPFNINTYPLIEYVQMGDALYFNIDIPVSAKVTINYYRMYETMRMRATLTRVDPVNESATPRITGYTLLGRDANGTSSIIQENPEVTWADLQYYPLGSNTQVNPRLNLVNIDSQGNQTFLPTSLSSTQIPAELPVGLLPPDTTEFHWFKVINCGSQTDFLRAHYFSNAGTSVFIDLTGSQFIVPDAGISNNLNYLLLASDGTNSYPIKPGQSILIAIGNMYKQPGTPQAIDPATIYSAQTPNYLQSQSWLFAVALPGQDFSAAEFVIS